MDKDEGVLQIDVLGTSFALQTDETSQYLDVLYNHFRIMLKHVENVTGSTDSLKTAIVAGILITDELFKERMKNPNADKTPELNEMEALALKMISSIDRVV